MKTMKRMISLLLALALVTALGIVTATAEGTTEGTSPTHSITITGAKAGEIYNAYKIFDVTVSGTAPNQKFSYTIPGSSPWCQVVDDYTVTQGDVFTLTPTPETAGTTNPVYTVTVNKDGDTSRLDAAEFAKYLAENVPANVTVSGTVTPNDTTPATINVSSSGSGYYFVDTSLGSLCSLDSVNGLNQEIKEKNTVPSIAKTVYEDEAGNYQDSATVDIVDEIKYKLTVNTGTNENNITGNPSGVDGVYTIEDTLPVGFNYNKDSETGKVKVTAQTNGASSATNWAEGPSDFQVEYTAPTETDPGKIKITLNAAKVAALKQDATITITYSAWVNDATKIQYGTNNTNTATLTYKEQEITVDADVKTFTIGTGFKKVDGSSTEATKPPLQGVKFVLYKNVPGTDGSTTKKYAKATLNTTDNAYYLTDWADEINETGVAKLTTDENGTFLLKGLDNDEYILEEVETLNGYNLLTDTITVSFDVNGNATYKKTNSTDTAGTTIAVENLSGTELPSTGGMGTTLFYIFGGILVVCAGVLLVTRKRMSVEG